MIIHGTGCCLIDYLYAHVDFSSPAFVAARSLREGDGGLTPGRLVFAEDFQRFIKKPYNQALGELTGGQAATSYNLGGPSVVALAHAAQMLHGQGHRVDFYGVRGTDSTAQLIDQALARLPFHGVHLVEKDAATARTDVLSDPTYDHGHGERTFINLIGAAGAFYPQDLPDDFFDADLVAFGGTGLVPPIHDALTPLLRRVRSRGGWTMVNLVYDFRSDLTAPGKKWKLGTQDDAYPLIDLLVADREEALKTSGKAEVDAAIQWFLDQGVGSVVVTQGSRKIRIASRGGLFAPQELTSLPVCEAVNRELAEHPERRGDTTGCGDNFAGGLMAGLVQQVDAHPASQGNLDLTEACVWANASGGFACFTIGGTYYEQRPGEKRERLLPYVQAYREQLAHGEA
jgi:sugar/nucleoside kinase (ribokinase family)